MPNEQDIEKVDVGNVDELAGQLDESTGKTLKTLAAQKAHFRDKAEKTLADKAKVEEELKALKERLASSEPKAKEENPPQSPATITVDDLLGFKKQGLSDAEIADAVEEARGLGVSVPKFIGSKLLKPWLDAKRAEDKSAGATPPPSNRFISFKEKPVHELSDKDIAANYAEISRKAVEEGKRRFRSGE